MRYDDEYEIARLEAEAERAYEEAMRYERIVENMDREIERLEAENAALRERLRLNGIQEPKMEE